MANMPSVNVRLISVTMPLELLAQVRSFAATHQMSINDAVRYLLDKALEDVELMPEDYEWIAAEVRKNIAKREGK